MMDYLNHAVSLSAVAAVVLAAGLASTASAVELSLKADARDALIIDDAPNTVTVTVKPAGQEEHGEYELRQQFVDRYGQETNGSTVKIELSGEWQHQVEVPVAYYGPATYRAALVKAGEDEPVATAEQMLIRTVPLPRLSAEERMKSPMGINVHVNARWETLAAMGIHWARDYSWGWLGDGSEWPKAPNGTNFGDVQPRAERAGITILPVMQRAFRTEDRKFFISDGDHIANAYERLSNAVPEFPYWELDNEADLEHRDQTTEDYRRWFETYIEYIRHADRGLRAAGQGAEVVLNGEAGIHLERTQEIIERAGDHFAVVNYHYYTGTVAPELAQNDINTGSEDRPRTDTFIDQMRQINRLAHDAGKEAWLTEIGWSARSGPAVGDRLQSAYLGRLFLLAEWAGTDKTFWFWDRELSPGGRFSSTEFVHSREGARPVGAAAAAVSKFIAQADYAGSVDIGADRWCLVFKRPEGGWTVAAWAVESEYDLPEPLRDAEESFDMYGNPLREPRLTAEPAYFYLESIPSEWETPLQVEWMSNLIVNVYQGSSAQVDMRMPVDGQIEWRDMPQGARGGQWQREDDLHTAEIQALPELAPGTYTFTAVATGDGWEKRFPLRLKVRPAVDVVAEPYTPGQPTEVRLANLLPGQANATLTPEEGEVRPSIVPLEGNGTATAAFHAPAGATGPIAMSITLSDGATREYWIRPRHLQVPRAGEITIDGDLSDWPDAGRLSDRALKVTGPVEDFTPEMRFAWSPQGLYVAAIIPVGEDFVPAQRPEDFWEWTSVEMNVNAADVRTEPGVTRSHLLWFTPTKDGEDQPWRIYAGQWRKPMPDGTHETIRDDDRPETAMRYDGQNVTVELLIPVEVLGTRPQAGHQWPITISSKLGRALSPRTVAAWPAGSGSGWEGWGRITFVE